MDVITKQADKNLGLVLTRGDIYNSWIRKWLQEPSFVKVTAVPHARIIKEVTDLVKDSESISPQQKWKIFSKLKANKDPCPFYATPKIHKKTVGSRPITAQHSYLLAGVSTVLADTLNRFVENEDAIGKDSKTTVARLEKLKLPPEFVFVTYDVEACYPSIDLEDAFNTLEHEMTPLNGIENGVYLKLLKIVMRNNYVTANGKIYVQKIGTATGTQVAPPFANLYLFHKFKSILSDSSIIFQERFIDDGLLLVKTEDDAKRIMENLQQASSLNLTWDISKTEAVYLDIHVYKGRRLLLDNKLDMKVYFKPTNKLLYLPYRSNHPIAMKTGIIRGEAIRTLRNTSDKGEWLKALQHVFKGLMARGYDPSIIKSQWKPVKFEDRNIYIFCSTSRDPPIGTLIKTSYHPKTQKWWKFLTSTRPISQVLIRRRMMWNKDQAALIKNWPPKIIWTNFKKIGNLAISAKERWTGPKKRKRRDQGGNSAKRLLSRMPNIGADPP